MNCAVVQLPEVPGEIRSGWRSTIEMLPAHSNPDDFIVSVLTSSWALDMPPRTRAELATMLLAIAGRGGEWNLRAVAELVSATNLSTGDRLRLRAAEAATELWMDPTVLDGVADNGLARWLEEARARIVAIRELRELDTSAINAAEQDPGNAKLLKDLSRMELRAVLARKAAATTGKDPFKSGEPALRNEIAFRDMAMTPREAFCEAYADLDAVRDIAGINCAAVNTLANLALLATYRMTAACPDDVDPVVRINIADAIKTAQETDVVPPPAAKPDTVARRLKTVQAMEDGR